MRPTICILHFLWLFLVAPKLSAQEQHFNFKYAEDLYYRVHYGFIKAGILKVQVDSIVHQFRNKPCYKIEIEGKTSGAIDWVAHIQDKWTSLIDTSSLKSLWFERILQENDYKKHELIEFDRIGNQAFVTNKEAAAAYKTEFFRLNPLSQDMVSSYFDLRAIQVSNLNVYDTLRLPIFYEDSNYTLKVVYLGKEKLKTDIGKFRAIVLSPVMPRNPIFAKENPIKSYFSDDYRRIPLRIEANLKVGAAQIDIEYYKGLSRKIPRKYRIKSLK
jgi:hypothetical protein